MKPAPSPLDVHYCDWTACLELSTVWTGHRWLCREHAREVLATPDAVSPLAHEVIEAELKGTRRKR